MRNIEANMFESTKKWIKEDKNNVYHLIIDELHLFRGTAGTEIAYVIRMFLDAIGVRPVIDDNGKKIPNPQLRILASSASLGDPDKTQEYLEQFFGVYYEDQPKNAFEIQQGSNYIPTLKNKLTLSVFNKIDQSFLLKDENEKKIVKSQIANELGYSDLKSYFKTEAENIFGHFIEVCKNEKGKVVPISMSALANKLFNGDQNALRGFLIMRGDEEINSIKDCKLPRIRFHQFYKYIEGLWTELLPQGQGKVQNPFGQLFYSPKTAVNSNDGAIHKVLETLRCEKCATAFIGGNKSVFSIINGQQKWELNLNNPDLSKIPNNSGKIVYNNVCFKLFNSKSNKSYRLVHS